MSGEALTRADALRARSQSFRSRVDRTYNDLAEQMPLLRNAYVALSGGKDSLVALAIMTDLIPRITATWVDDELEHAETPIAVQRQSEHLGATFQTKLGTSTHNGWFVPWVDEPFWRDPLSEAGDARMPSTEWAPLHGFDAVVLGLRADEATYRRSHARRKGTFYERANGLIVFQPLIWWTIDDIWAFIASRELPYHPVYDTLARAGVSRELQRVGPFPLAPRWFLATVDPTLPARLEARYGHHW